MKHAGPEALARLEPLLGELRGRTALVEKRPGVFYRRSHAFLHFHEDPAGLFADVRLAGDFSRRRVTTRAEQRALLRGARWLAGPSGATGTARIGPVGRGGALRKVARTSCPRSPTMELSPTAWRLCRHGVLLFFLGLLNGALVGAFTNPRMGLSAHLAGVQNGLSLLAFGLLWPHLSLSPRLERFAAWAGIASMWAIWIALALAAAFGTSRATPIAGAGFQGTAWQEWLVTTLLYSGSLAILAAVAVVLRAMAGGPRRR